MQGLKLLKSKYFRKLYLTFSGFFLIVLLGISFLVSFNLNETIYKNELASVKEKLALFSPQAKKVFLSENYEGAQSIFPPRSELSHIRYTLVVPRGELIADSHNLLDTTVRGWEREEIRDAVEAEDQIGVAYRYSEVYGEDAFLMARAVTQDGVVLGVVRADTPVSAMKAHIGEIAQIFTGVAVVCVFAAFVFGFFMAKSVAEPISQMASVCRAISRGDYSRRVTSLPKDEVGQLGETLNNLSQDMLQKIKALSLERTQLKSILTVMNEGIISVNETADIIFCNRNAYRILKSPEEDVRGRSISEVKGFDVLAPMVKSALLKKKFSQHTVKIVREHVSGGSPTKTIEVFAAYYNTKNYRDPLSAHVELKNSKGAILVINDVTEMKKLEGMRQDFIANVSHELKTPLTSIRGYVETLLGGAIDDPKFARRFVHKIEVNADRLTNLVYDLLNLAKIEEDGAVELRAIQWLPIVQSTLERHESLLLQKKINVEVAKTEGGQAVSGEFESMSTILENLLTNAIRYSPEGGHIKVWFNREGANQKIHVTDTGIGISEENMSRIFERFYRADKARSREVGGTGLGLSIVKHLVQRIGGTIDVESVEGIGSTFTVSLPRAF